MTKFSNDKYRIPMHDYQLYANRHVDGRTMLDVSITTLSLRHRSCPFLLIQLCRL